jgi:hypothetical protein
MWLTKGDSSIVLFEIIVRYRTPLYAVTEMQLSRGDQSNQTWKTLVTAPSYNIFILIYNYLSKLI